MQLHLILFCMYKSPNAPSPRYVRMYLLPSPDLKLHPEARSSTLVLHCGGLRLDNVRLATAIALSTAPNRNLPFVFTAPIIQIDICLLIQHRVFHILHVVIAAFFDRARGLGAKCLQGEIDRCVLMGGGVGGLAHEFGRDMADEVPEDGQRAADYH